jgi:hypothetical protein
MPAMPGMSEMREYVNMEGSWQVRVKIGGRMIYKDINVPIKGGGSKGHEHGSKFDNINISLYKVDSLRVPVLNFDSLIKLLENSPNFKYRDHIKRSKRYENFSKILPLTLSPGILYHDRKFSFSLSIELPIWILK